VKSFHVTLSVLVLSICVMAQQPAPTPAAPAQSANQSANPQPKPLVIPDKFTNLMVLPKDISKQDLVTIMKQFSMTFGVRCSYCHAVSDDLTEGNLASDEKQTKLKARKLLAMILEIKQMGAETPKN